MGRLGGTAIQRAKDAVMGRWDSMINDSWQNTVTLLGTVASSLNWHRLTAADWLDEESLEAAYIDDPIARRIIREPVDAAFRQGWDLVPPKELDHDAAQDQEREIRKLLRELRAEELLKQAEYWGRLYGRGGLMLGANDGRSATMELEPERVSELKWLQPLKSEEFYVDTTHGDPDAPLFGEPETWRVNRTSQMFTDQAIVHESRIILTRGVPTHKEERETWDWRDIPVLQGVYADLRNYDSTKTGLAQMLTDASQAVLKVRNLAGILADNSEVLRTRLRILEMARALHVMPIDAGGDGSVEESFEFVERTFSGVADSFDRMLGALASAVGWPQTYLFGRSPAGENATGESDQEIWDDMVKASQAEVYQPHLQQLVTLAAYATGATEPDAWQAEFKPLRQETDMERVNREKAIAETDAIYVSMGALDELSVAKHRFGGDDYNAQPVRLEPEDVEAMEKLQEMDRERALNPPEPPEPFAANAAAPLPPELQGQQPPGQEIEEPLPDEGE